MILTLLALTQVQTPRVGSAERTAILDAIRPHVFESSAKDKRFSVDAIAADRRFAYAAVLPYDPEAPGVKKAFLTEGEYVAFFLRRSGKGWRLMGYLPDAHEGVAQQFGYLVDLSPMTKRGFPLRLLASAKGRSYIPSYAPKLGPIYTIRFERGKQREAALSPAALARLIARKNPADPETTTDGTYIYRLFRPRLVP